MTDFVGVYAAQRNEARRVFGLGPKGTAVGQTNIYPYPSLEATYARRLIKYWKDNATVLFNRITVGKESSGIPDTAHKEQWLRYYAMLPQLDIYTAGTIAGILPESSTKQIWDVLDQVVIPMRGLTETPTRWDLLKDSFPDLVGPNGIFPEWMKWAAIAGIGIWAYGRLK
jgi:hypothetical protein